MPGIGVVASFYFRGSVKYLVISYCSYNLHYPNGWLIFLVLYFFSRPVACFFIFGQSFSEQNFKILMTSYLLILSFMDCDFGIKSKNSYLVTHYQIFYYEYVTKDFRLFFFPKSFIFSCFTFKSDTFWVNMWGLNFFFPYSILTLCVKKANVHPLNYFCTFFLKISWVYFVGICFWVFYIVPLIFKSVLAPKSQCLNYDNCINRHHISSTSFLFKMILAILGPMPLHVSIRIGLSCICWQNTLLEFC